MHCNDDVVDVFSSSTVGRMGYADVTCRAVAANNQDVRKRIVTNVETFSCTLTNKVKVIRMCFTMTIAITWNR